MVALGDARRHGFARQGPASAGAPERTRHGYPLPTAPTHRPCRTRLTVEGVARDYPSIEQLYRALNPQPGNDGSFLRKTRDMWLRDPYIAREELATIGVPVPFLVGDRDDVRIEHLADMYRALKKAEMFVVPNPTHFLLFEKPDLVVPMVLDFLRR